MMKNNKSLVNQIADKQMLRRSLKMLNQRACPGSDGLSYQKLKKHFDRIVDKFCVQLMDGSYIPKEIFRVYIPKRHNPNDFRMLGIPSVQDRLIQAAMVNVLSPLYEPTFSNYSFGFIKGRNCHQALQHVIEFANEGKNHVVNIDLRKFFDNVPHEKLIAILSRTIDKDTLDLIQKYLKCKVVERKIDYISEKGVPQGGPLSPLLSNITLNELDKYLETNNISFVRYADDCIVLCSSEYEAIHVFKSLSRFIEHTLGLDINYQKSSISDITDIKYLGYGFKKDTLGKYVLDVKSEQIEELKEKISFLIGKMLDQTPDKIFIQKVMEITRGWVNYYAYAEILDKLQEFDEWFVASIADIQNDNIADFKSYINELMALGYSFPDSIGQYNIEHSLYGKPYSNTRLTADMRYLQLRKLGYKTTVELYLNIRQKWKLD